MCIYNIYGRKNIKTCFLGGILSYFVFLKKKKRKLLKFFTELLGINPKLKIVVCTAYMDDDEQEKIHEVGVSDIMTKPIDPMKIRKRVRELVGEWEQG